MKRLLCWVLCLTACAGVAAQERSYGRSLVISQKGIVATSQVLASQAGAQILARGGSAVDAAIAANAVLAVVEPMMCGIGGDLFAIHWNARTGKLTALNASGWTPKRIGIGELQKKDVWSMPATGIHTVSVPGAVDGWSKMHQKFGKLPWRDLFQPAIYYATHGFAVTEFIQWDWENAQPKLLSDENARRVMLKDGKAPQVGGIFRNPELAQALRLVADGGAAAFYRGPVGEAILKTSQRLGGFMAADDLAEYQSEWVEPLVIDYRGWKVFQMPPNGQGVGTLEMLNIMETFPLGDYGPMSADAFHYKIEAQKLSVLDLKQYVGDPRHTHVPVEGLLSKSYAKERAQAIDSAKARCDYQPGTPPAGGHETVYLSVIDGDGNIVSWVQSISDIFGSGVMVDGMGFHLQDRAGGMTFDTSHPNALAPRKRPFHTIIPGFMENGGRHIAFGIMRGMNQAQAQAQFVSNVVDHGMNIQAALEAPRFTRLNPGGCDVRMESRVPKEVRDALEQRGHTIGVVGDYSGLMGGGQAVMRDTRLGVNFGASSPRKDGAAVPEPDPYFNVSKGRR